MRYSVANINTALMLLFTAVPLLARARARPDTNLPLIYFLFVFLYHLAYPGKIEPNSIYAGVICSLFLRFEFMRGWVSRALQIGEAIVLIYLAYTFWDNLV